MARKHKALTLKPPKRINNLVVISDQHIGCQLGLCHPDGARLDEGGKYMPNEFQQYVWEKWEEFWKEWIPQVCKGEPFAVCNNGDAMDGSHHNSTHQWSHNLSDQADMAYKILQPVVEACDGRYYHIRGTEAHSGISGTEEERLAKRLHAIPNEQGQCARYELWTRVGNGLVHLTHHIGTAGSMAYESSAVMREMTEAVIESGRWNEEAPDVIGRSHRHRNVEVRVQTHKGFSTAFTTPAWQLRTPFAFKVAGARQSSPQIGGSVIRYGGEDIFTRHKVWTLPRGRVEEL